MHCSRFGLAVMVFGLMQTSFAQGESECRKAQDLALKNPGLFSGYGMGATQEAATESARGDLARQIRAKVVATGRATEDSKSTSYQGSSASEASEVLVGTRVVKACEKGKEFEAVVQLHRALFLKNFEKRLFLLDEQAESFLEKFRKSDNAASKVDATGKARKFLLANKDVAENDLALCQSFDGCLSIKLPNLQELSKALDRSLGSDEFRLIATNSEAEKAKSRVVSLLKKEGIKISEERQDDNRAVRVECNEEYLEPTQGFSRHTVRLNCEANGLVGGKQVFSYEFSAKGFGDDRKGAAQAARGNLEKE